MATDATKKKPTSGVLYAISLWNVHVSRLMRRWPCLDLLVLITAKGLEPARFLSLESWNPTFEESQPSAAGHFGEFKQIV